MAMTTYGDISPAVSASAAVTMLKRAVPVMPLERFAQTVVLDQNDTKVKKFRRYYLVGATGAGGSAQATGLGTPAYGLPTATTPLVEGVTPAGRKLTNQDYTATLEQFGDWAELSDVIMDTHTDPILNVTMELLGESFGLTLEQLRFNKVKAGTQVAYPGSATSRATVASTISLQMQRRITTALNRQMASKFTEILGSTTSYGKQNVEASYFAVAHPDLETAIRSVTDAGGNNVFIPVAKYGNPGSAVEGEIGSIEQVRYVLSTVIEPWIDSGAAIGSTGLRSTSGTLIDVYPILYFARDAWATVALRGANSVRPMVVNPKASNGDPLGQRGSVGVKTYHTSIILNDMHLVRFEVGAPN